MSFILQVFYSIISGLFLALSIPNELSFLGCPFIAFFAIIPFYLAIRKCKNFKQAFFLFFIQTAVTHLASSFWLGFFKDFAEFTLGGSAAATAVTGGIAGIFIFLPFSQNNRLKEYRLFKPVYNQPFFRIIYFTSVYTLYEWIKSIGFLGYPWGTVSSAMFQYKFFIQIADITGTYGITFLTVFFNALLGEFLCLLELKQNTTKKLISEIKSTALCFLMLFAASNIYGAYHYYAKRTPVKQLTTVMVQINLDPWTVDDQTESILWSEQMTEKEIQKLKDEGKTPQLVVWSEGSLSGFFPGAKGYYKYTPTEKPFLKFVKDIQTPVLSGGGVSETATIKYKGEEIHSKNLYNSALMFDSNGNYCGYYGKLHLVPFAESIPGIDNPVIKKIMMKLVHISAGWHKGKYLTYFDVPCTVLDEKYTPLVQNIKISLAGNGTDNHESYLNNKSVKIATPICFDDAFTDVMRPLSNNGAELFVNLTDDSWSLKKSSEYQHFCVAAYRAIEYRTTLVRSTNAGYSVVVDPAGKILADMPLFERQSMSYDVPVYPKVTTVYAKLGNWLPYILLLLMIATSVSVWKNLNK